MTSVRLARYGMLGSLSMRVFTDSNSTCVQSGDVHLREALPIMGRGKKRSGTKDDATPGMLVFLPCGCTAICGIARKAPDRLLVDVIEPCRVHSKDLPAARRLAYRQIAAHRSGKRKNNSSE